MIFELEPIFNNIGLSLPIEYSMDFSDVEIDLNHPFTVPVHVHGSFRNCAGVVSVEAVADCTLSLFCDRCACAFVQHFAVPVSHILVRELNDENNDALIRIESFRFDLDSLVSDDIFLSLPSKFLCQPDCRGLCAQCGQNLNDGPCSCKKPVDPRLEGLLQLLDNS